MVKKNIANSLLSAILKKIVFMLFVFQTNKNLDMSINASNNFNINITWSIGSTGKVFHVIFQNKNKKEIPKEIITL